MWKGFWNSAKYFKKSSILQSAPRSTSQKPLTEYEWALSELWEFAAKVSSGSDTEHDEGFGCKVV